MRELSRYVAFDGTSFDSESDCEVYEGEIFDKLRSNEELILYTDYNAAHGHHGNSKYSNYLYDPDYINAITINSEKARKVYTTYTASCDCDKLPTEIFKEGATGTWIWNDWIDTWSKKENFYHDTLKKIAEDIKYDNHELFTAIESKGRVK